MYNNTSKITVNTNIMYIPYLSKNPSTGVVSGVGSGLLLDYTSYIYYIKNNLYA